MPACHTMASSLSELLKAKSVKFIGVLIDSFICVDGSINWAVLEVRPAY